jgi:NADH-quinone oxidoreductase subunit K
LNPIVSSLLDVGVLALQQAGLVERLEPTVTTFLLLSFLLFTIGTVGVLTRRNVIIIFMSIELILNAVNLNLVAFSRYWELQGRLSAFQGQVFAIFVIVVAAAEAAVGLAIALPQLRDRRRRRDRLAQMVGKPQSGIFKDPRGHSPRARPAERAGKRGTHVRPTGFTRAQPAERAGKRGRHARPPGPARAQPAERAAFGSPGRQPWEIRRKGLEPAERAALATHNVGRGESRPLRGLRRLCEVFPGFHTPRAARLIPPWANESRPLRGLCARGSWRRCIRTALSRPLRGLCGRLRVTCSVRRIAARAAL